MSSFTLQYYTGTQNGVLIAEVSTFQRFVMERSHCIVIAMWNITTYYMYVVGYLLIAKVNKSSLFGQRQRVSSALLPQSHFIVI